MPQMPQRLTAITTCPAAGEGSSTFSTVRGGAWLVEYCGSHSLSLVSTVLFYYYRIILQSTVAVSQLEVVALKWSLLYHSPIAAQRGSAVLVIGAGALWRALISFSARVSVQKSFHLAL
jgi:hypothetical protein